MDKENIISLYQEGWTRKKIRKEMNLSLEVVDHALREIPGAVPIPDEETCKEIIADYLSGMKINDMQVKYKKKGSTFTNIFHAYGIEKKRRRTNQIDGSFFETINTEEKAYWLGFLFADGYNSEKRGCIEIGLSSTDKDHLEKLKISLSAEHEIKTRNQYGYESVRLMFNSRQMSTDLANHGCVQKKSLVLVFPETVPTELEHHFIRGYFDGDGCISVNTISGKVNTSFIGTESFLESVRKRMKLSDTKLELKGNAFTLQYGGRINALKIFEYLYKDSTVFLDRKRDKFLIVS